MRPFAKFLITIVCALVLMIAVYAQRGQPIRDLTKESKAKIDSINKIGSPYYDTLDCKRRFSKEFCVGTLSYLETSVGFYNVLKILHNGQTLVTIYQTPEVIQEVIFDCNCKDGRLIAIINDPRLKLDIITHMSEFEELVANNFFAHKFSFMYTLRYGKKALVGEYYRYGDGDFRRRDIVD